MLAPGEFVLRSEAVDRIGRRTLEALNAGRSGGATASHRTLAPAKQTGAPVAAIEAAARAGARAAGRELAAALAHATFRIDDRGGRIAGVRARSG
jgi:hypothetical protein